MKVIRFEQNPIIRAGMDERMGENINGPSLIRVPDWLENPLGKYYLYFGHHGGKYVRLAYADRLEGSWKIHSPGVLDLEDAFAEHHIASPDVHVDNERREFRMYYHGPTGNTQKTRVAISKDGRHFIARPEILGGPYFRVFQWDGWYYAMSMPGIFYRSKDGLTGFEQGPTPFSEIIKPPRRMRHFAFKLDGGTLSIFYSCIGDTPERILMSAIQLKPDWNDWTPSPEVEVIAPEMEYEGADCPLETSRMGWAPERIRQLRDPGIFLEDGKTYLLYAVAGEHGIGVCELTTD